ncbi:DKNYY domain-containing protein [Neisseria montereyensis]|uniref:DKNYY domain-containing protein n=1 Tax=Neisseria montereyensis TaxID=2973938 RepID=A0ABT2FBS2_9NEIS|nr:DKNYY domain-containing protein [Neisseria montereyensis]MCS4533010.1 DKNYY domain-containing protein [Neisseria montereyensis]
MIVQENKSSLFWKKLLLLIPVFVSMFVFVRILAFPSESVNPRQAGENLFGVFYKYQGEIYADYWRVHDVDIATFRLLDKENGDKHIAVDKNHVYAGYQILPDLDPKKTVALGSGYYSDGNTTYYSGGGYIRNESLPWWKEVPEIILHSLFNYEQTPNQVYPFVKLPKSDSPYFLATIDVIPIIKGNINIASVPTFKVLTNGQQVYYDGLLMEDANWQSLFQLRMIRSNGMIAESRQYFSDGRHIYHTNQKLALPYNDEIYSIAMSGFYAGKEYILNPKDGMVYIADFAFDKDHAPYSPTSSYNDNVYHGLFSSNDGIYFYDDESKKVKRAGDNLFLNQHFKEIAPLVFSDGKRTLFISTKEEHYHAYKNGGIGTTYYATFIGELDAGLNNNWEPIGETRNGSVWKNGSRYFYFDEYDLKRLISEKISDLQRGESAEIIRNIIYEIKNEQIAKELLQSSHEENKAKELLEKGDLIPVKFNEKLEAFSTPDKMAYFLKKYINFNYIMVFMFLGIVIITISGHRKKRKKL